MALNTPGVSKAWAPDSTFFPAEDVLPDALYLLATTKGGEIQGDEPSLRVAYVDDADSADFVAEGAEIPLDDPTLDEVTLQTRKISRLVKLSREQHGQPNTAEAVARSVARDLTRKMDRALLLQVAPTPPAVAPSTGLVNTAGLITGDPVTADLDPLVDAVAEIQANLGNPKLLIVDPLAFAHLYKMRKGTGSNEGLLTPATATPTSPVLGLQVVVNPLLTANTALLVDPTAVVSAYSAVEVATSMDAFFTSDSVAMRATVRVGHVVVKPNRVALLTIGAA